MNVSDILKTVVDWVEVHEHTVDVLKWCAAALGAWALGIFRALRAWSRRPSISVNTVYSNGYRDLHASLGSHRDVALLVFVLDAEVLNPTNSRIGVRRFDLQINRTGLLKRWTTPAFAVGFPSMPSTPMPGDNIKVVPIWMTSFEGYSPSLTLKQVDPHDSVAGLVFFAVVVPTAILPPPTGRCLIKLGAILTTGEKRTAKVKIMLHSDMESLGKRISGGVAYVRHAAVWVHRT